MLFTFWYSWCVKDFTQSLSHRPCPLRIGCLHVTLPTHFWQVSLSNLLFLHQFCMCWPEIKKLNPCVLYCLGAFHIILWYSSFMFFWGGFQGQTTSAPEVCLQISYNFACTCLYVYFRCLEVLINFRFTLTHESCCTKMDGLRHRVKVHS